MILRQPDDCSPWGIVRPALPPDDAHTDAMCSIAAAVEHARIDLHLASPAFPQQAAIPAAPPTLRVERNRPPVSAARSGAGVEANRLASPCRTNRTN